MKLYKGYRCIIMVFMHSSWGSHQSCTGFLEVPCGSSPTAVVTTQPCHLTDNTTVANWQAVVLQTAWKITL